MECRGAQNPGAMGEMPVSEEEERPHRLQYVVLQDHETPPIIWPFYKGAEKAYTTWLDRSSRISDRCWSAFMMLASLNTRSDIPYFLRKLQVALFLAALLVFAMSFRPGLHLAKRRSVLSILRAPMGLGLSILSAAAYRRMSNCCITGWPSFLYHIVLIRSRFIVAMGYTSAFHLGIIQHIALSTLMISWTAVAINAPECAAFAASPQVHAIMSSVGKAATRAAVMASTQLPWVPLGVFEAVRAWFDDPTATCMALRLAGQISVLVGTTAVLVAMEMRARRKFAGLVGVPMPSHLPLQQAAIHAVTVIVVIVLSMVVALLTAGFIRELPGDVFGALLFPVSEIDGLACTM